MSPVAAQERSNRRTLAGHSFIASSLVSDPFVGTYIRTITGGGRALDLQVPVYNLDGDQIASLGGNIAYFLLGLGYQQQLAKWVALRVSVSGSARLGTNHISLLAEGATAVYGGTFGATFRLIEKRRFYFSATAEARSNSLYGVSPLTFAQKVIESGGVDSTTQLLSSGDNWRLVGGLRAAYAFAPWVGLTGLVEYGPAKRFFANEEGERNTRQLTMGGLASVDLRPGTGVPIGFTGSVRYQSEGDQGDDLASRQAILGLGVFYTGRRDLSLGLEASYQRLNQRDVETKINASQIRLILRYDF
jgi:hypothetical protein